MLCKIKCRSISQWGWLSVSANFVAHADRQKSLHQSFWNQNNNSTSLGPLGTRQCIRYQLNHHGFGGFIGIFGWFHGISWWFDGIWWGWRVMFRLTLAPGDWEGHLGWTGRDCLGLAAGTRNGRLQMSPGDHHGCFYGGWMDLLMRFNRDVVMDHNGPWCDLIFSGDA